jgi:hypothetical protein
LAASAVYCGIAVRSTCAEKNSGEALSMTTTRTSPASVSVDEGDEVTYEVDTDEVEGAGVEGGEQEAGLFSGLNRRVGEPHDLPFG